MRKIDICNDQEGHKGRGIDLMNTMHFDAFAIHILLRCKIIFLMLELIIFLHLQKFLLHFFIPRWNCLGCGDAYKLLFGRFLIMISVDIMALTHDS